MGYFQKHPVFFSESPRKIFKKLDFKRGALVKWGCKSVRKFGNIATLYQGKIGAFGNMEEVV